MGTVMEYYSVIKRNTNGSFVGMWMDLESVIPSEVSQKEKNKYYILIHIYMEIENRCADTGEGAGGTNWESGTDIYTLP